MRARFAKAVSALLVFGLLLVSVGAQAVRDTSYNDTKGEGKALVEEILARGPAEDSEILGLLKVRPPEGSMLEVPIRMVVKVVEGGWDDIYETQPVKGRPGEIFMVKHRGTNLNEYFFGTFKTMDAKREVKKLSREGLYRPLAETDFNFFELGLEFLHWPSQKIVKKEM